MRQSVEQTAVYQFMMIFSVFLYTKGISVVEKLL